MKLLVVLSLFFVGFQASAADCFRQSAVSGFESNGKNSVIVHALKDDYQVETFVCFELEWANAIAFQPWAGFGSRICKGDDLFVIDQFSGRAIEKCRISKITKLSKN